LEHKALVVVYDPLHYLSLLEFDGLGDGGRKIDVPLFTFGPLDELDFGWISHI
jgi:hypothetical protein